MRLSRAELSRVCNISKSAITKAVKETRLVLDNDSKIDPFDLTNKIFIEKFIDFSDLDKTKDNRKSLKKTKSKMKKKEQNLDEIKIPKTLEGYSIEDIENPDNFKGMPLSVWKIRESILMAKQRRIKLIIENEYKRGVLVDRKLTESMIFNYLNVLSERLFSVAESLPIDFVSICATEKDEFKKTIKIKEKLIDQISNLIKDTQKIIDSNLKRIIKEPLKEKVDKELNEKN